jgi:phage terminase small subunit
MKDVERLTDKQRRYVERLASGMDSPAAALSSGYSESYAKVAGSRLMKNHAVAKELESIRSEAR